MEQAVRPTAEAQCPHDCQQRKCMPYFSAASSTPAQSRGCRTDLRMRISLRCRLRAQWTLDPLSSHRSAGMCGKHVDCTVTCLIGFRTIDTSYGWQLGSWSQQHTTFRMTGYKTTRAMPDDYPSGVRVNSIRAGVLNDFPRVIPSYVRRTFVKATVRFRPSRARRLVRNPLVLTSSAPILPAHCPVSPEDLPYARHGAGLLARSEPAIVNVGNAGGLRTREQT
jgi:hypothetical protein